MAKSVRDIMTANPISMPASASIVEAAQRMRDNSIGSVLLEKDGKFCGLVTDRDIVVRGVAEGKDPQSINLESICSTEMVTLSPNQSEEDAVQLMRSKAIRRLPVLENGTAIGIVALGDLAVDGDPDSVLAEVSAARANA